MSATRRLALIIFIAGATALVARRLDVRKSGPYDITYVPTAESLRWASLGHPTLAADLYWLKAVQYIGEPHANERGWGRLYPVADLVTDLDPRHGYAYQVAGIILGSVGRVQESNAILEKGIRRVPDRYYIPYVRAFNAFFYEGDFAEAGRFVELAARAPAAPPHIPQTAMAFYVKGHKPEAAIQFLQRLLADTHDPESANALEEQLKQAYLERDAAELEAALAAYEQRHGSPARRLEQLVESRLIARIPPDPFGGSYVLGSDGRVHSSVHAFRFKRADEIPLGVEPGVKRPDENSPTGGY